MAARSSAAAAAASGGGGLPARRVRVSPGVQQQQQQPAPPLTLPPKPVLMLPAPVRDPAMDALDALAASLKAHSARQPLPAAAAATHFADQSRAA